MSLPQTVVSQTNLRADPGARGKTIPPRSRSFLNEVAVQTRELPRQPVASALAAGSWETKVSDILIKSTYCGESFGGA